MSRFGLKLAALVLAASVPGSAYAGWGFSYHSDAPHHHYYCPGPVCGPYGGYAGHYYHAPYAPPYVPHHHHWHGPPRAAFFLGF